MGSTKISQPAAPTTTSSISDYIQNYPALFQLQSQYAPMEAQQQVDLANQYAGQLGTAYKKAQEAMYPEENAFTKEALANAKTGMEQGLPDWAKETYMDTMRGQLGENALSGVGADYMSRGLMQQQQDWKNYYTNLGLSIAGKQPIYTSNTMPTTNNIMSGYTPQGVMDYNSRNYGTAANVYGTQMQYGQSSPWMSMLGGIGGSVLGNAAGAGGGIFKNIFG